MIGELEGEALPGFPSVPADSRHSSVLLPTLSVESVRAGAGPCSCKAGCATYRGVRFLLVGAIAYSCSISCILLRHVQ